MTDIGSSGGKIAGVDKKFLWIGIAAVGGYVAYAYWKSANAAPSVPADPENPASVDQYDSPLGNSGTNSTSLGNSQVNPDTIDTNAEWTAAAVETLQGAGWDATAILVALGKLLAFKSLSANEVQIAQAAKASQGEPPTGGPYPIKEALPDPTPTTPTTMAKPSGLHMTVVGPTTARADWSDVPGAVGYRIGVNGVYRETTYASMETLTGLKKKTKYVLSVQARSATSQLGPAATVPFTTKAS